MEEEIINLTEKLLKYNEKFRSIYQEAREQEIKQDFLNVIKPFSEEVKRVNMLWKEKMTDWLAKHFRKTLHLHQVKSTSEHIEQMSIQAFFPETSKSRFINANRTVEYFLLEILKEMRR